MSEPFLGQIMLVPYNFAPRGWAFCNGQILPIAQNTALFSLLGTTLAVMARPPSPCPICAVACPIALVRGLAFRSYDLGQVGGTETDTLTVNQMPTHNHLVNVNAGSGDSWRIANNYLANSASERLISHRSPARRTMAPQMISNTGGNQPFEILQPYLTLNYCIALEGIFPSRN